MRELRSSLREGDLVEVRGEEWVLDGLEVRGAHTMVSLRGCGSGNAGEACTLVTPFDQPRARARRTRWRESSRAHAIVTAAAVVAAAHPHASLRAAGHARMDLLPWQLAPALAVVAGHPRLLVADEVGLGKTVQAALVVAELQARGEAARVLVLTPAGLRAQWVEELQGRCRLEAVLVDQTRLARDRAALPEGVNPWRLYPVAVTSIDLIRQPEVLGALDGLPLDLLIVDEAHHAAAGTDRGRAVRVLAAQALRVLLLTATPHPGHDGPFQTLCAIGAVTSAEPILVFRRTHADVGLVLPRRTHALRVTPSDPEALLFSALREYVAWLHAEARADARVALLASVLGRRAASGAAALARTLTRRKLLLDAPVSDEGQLLLPWDEPDARDDCVPDHVAGLLLPVDRPREHRLLDALIRHAAHAEGGAASKRRVLLRLLRRVNEPAIVFTEYRDTLDDLRPLLEAHGDVVTLHGGMARADREAAVRSFVSESARWLLATDAGSEGLNLQARCRVAVNVEVPPGPTRYAQRAGRVSRLGQQRTVHVFTLVHADGFDAPALARFEDRRTAIDDALAPDRLPQDAIVQGFRRAAEQEAARVASGRRLREAGPRTTDRAAGRRTPCAMRSRQGIRSIWRLIVSATTRDATGRVTETAVVGVTVRWRAVPPRGWRAVRGALTTLLEHVALSGVFEARAAALQPERERAHGFLLARVRALLAGTAARHRYQPALFDDRAAHRARASGRRADDAASWWRGHLLRIQSGGEPCRVDPPVLRAAYLVTERDGAETPPC